MKGAIGAYSERILIAMLTDDKLIHRELAWRRIIRAREENCPIDRIINYKIPIINKEASNYTEFINWENIH